MKTMMIVAISILVCIGVASAVAAPVPTGCTEIYGVTGTEITLKPSIPEADMDKYLYAWIVLDGNGVPVDDLEGSGYSFTFTLPAGVEGPFYVKLAVTDKQVEGCVGYNCVQINTISITCPVFAPMCKGAMDGAEATYQVTGAPAGTTYRWTMTLDGNDVTNLLPPTYRGNDFQAGKNPMTIDWGQNAYSVGTYHLKVEYKLSDGTILSCEGDVVVISTPVFTIGRAP